MAESAKTITLYRHECVCVYVTVFFNHEQPEVIVFRKYCGATTYGIIAKKNNCLEQNTYETAHNNNRIFSKL